MKTQGLLTIYGIYCIIYMFGLLFLPENILFYAKCLLMPILICSVWKSEYFALKKYLLLALIFSWVGDIVIAFAPKGEQFFMYGLLSFLLAHLSYIILFYKSKQYSKTQKPRAYWPFLLLLLYIIALLWILLPSLGALKIPVLLYALVLGSMLDMALKVWPYVPNRANNDYSTWILLGAVSFVLSDSLLAINKFCYPLPLSSLLIMGTYLFAQYGISYGIMKNNKAV